MPKYDIIIKNRTYRVELVRKKGEKLFEAKMNGKPVELKLEKTEIDTTSSFTIDVAGKRYQIEIERIDRHAPFALYVNDAPFMAELRRTSKRIAILTTTAEVVAKGGRRRVVVEKGAIVAPMAGKIVSVNVKKGDVVNAGDVICLLEAMKMENEITATTAGKIQEVTVAEGTTVNEGDVLAIIK